MIVVDCETTGLEPHANGLFPELIIGLNKSDLKRAKLLELENPQPKGDGE